ncbi:hypothetical protein CK203_038582 [Vitis vinifera]|uniref:Uncharacterized protein n=1 Tax=Vitis vinifera TaxID=29760 RepID=A0A438I449_VITVI|nr:hypothetical protein CK203_038582 [Vitis vinifera]
MEKKDLDNAASSDELARYLDLKNLDERIYMFEAVSTFDGMGIKESMDWLVEVMERSKRTEMFESSCRRDKPSICLENTKSTQLVSFTASETCVENQRLSFYLA